jgi:hypothetical protein
MHRTLQIAAIVVSAIVALAYAHYDRSLPDIKGEYLVAKAGGPDVLLINGLYCAPSKAGIEVVGDCAGEGISWTEGKKVTLRADGWYELKLNGTDPRECHVTLYGCNGSHSYGGTGAWANYSDPSSMAQAKGKAGPYMNCTDQKGGNACTINFVPRKGHAPAPTVTKKWFTP